MISKQMRLLAPMLFFFPFMLAQAQWSSDPALNNPICRAGNKQQAPRAVSDGKGGAIICWSDERTAENFSRIHVQRIDRDGYVRWLENGIAISPVLDSNNKPEIISDDAGGAIIAWVDTRDGNLDVYAQRIDSSGNALWTAEGVPVATGSLDQIDPKLATDGQHGAIVTWSGHSGTSEDGHIYAQRIDGNGNRVWNPELSLSFSDQFEATPCIASDGSGGAYIAWVFYNNAAYDVIAQRVNSSGFQLWQSNGLGIATAGGPQDSPSLVADGTGKVFLSYYDWNSGSTPTLHVAVVNPDGSTAASLRVTSTSGGQTNPRLSNIGAGLLGIVWEDGRVSRKTRAYAQIIDNTGNKSWAADGVEISNRTGSQATPFVVPDGNGGMVVSWEDMTGGITESDICVQRLSASGSLLWSGAGVPLCTAGRMQTFPWMVSDGQNGAIVVWEDYRLSFSNPEIYASRILGDGTFPIGPPILTFSSKSVAFGVVNVGSPSTKNITLSNTGGMPVTITSITSNDMRFSLTPENSTIDPKGSVMAAVRFEPTSKDAVTAYLVVHSNSVFGPDTVTVTGSGIAFPAIAVDRISLNFGNVKTGSSKPLALKITNTGNDTLNISSIVSSNPVFTVDIASRILAGGESYDATVTFSPTAGGSASGELTLTSNAPDSPKILPLSGVGTREALISIGLTQISFGTVRVGSQKDTTVTITNPGNDTLRIWSFTSDDARFTLETPIAEIMPAEDKTFTLRFTPDAAGPFSSAFVVTSNAATTPDSIMVLGTGEQVSAVRSLQVVPGAFTLFQNYPNPFHPSTTIRYDLEISAPVHLTVCNSLGEVVATLVDETQRPGTHTVQWTSTDRSPGVYFLVLRVGAHKAFGRMVVMQ